MSKAISGTIGAGCTTATPKTVSALTPASTNAEAGIVNNTYGDTPKR